MEDRMVAMKELEQVCKEKILSSETLLTGSVKYRRQTEICLEAFIRLKNSLPFELHTLLFDYEEAIGLKEATVIDILSMESVVCQNVCQK